MKQCLYPFGIAAGIALCCLTPTTPTQAQVVKDTTLNTSVTTQGNITTLTGGTQAGSNLFHSFDQFSVSNGNTAYFNNTTDIQNIISRVTGLSNSNIEGTIQANGTANLFLLNPNGIIFGPNASLNIGGSFLASTASSLVFADGTEFSATAYPTTSLLTISVPTGLQFNGTASSIQNRSAVSGTDSTGAEYVVGLQVQPGKTLALVGGEVVLEGGYLRAEAGRIELGGVAGTGSVSLNPTAQGWVLGYEGIQNFQDIQVSQGALMDTTGQGGGDIQVQGRRVILTEGSQITSTNIGSEPGGTLTVAASDSVEVSGTSPDGKRNSGLFTITEAGRAGNITINTRQLIVQNQAFISTETQPTATGAGGNLTVIATESVTLLTNSSLLTQTVGSGNAGDLRIETGQLIVRDGAMVSASTFDQGKGGEIWVNASSVDIFGVGSDGISSGLYTFTDGTGQGGNITVDTRDFRVADGGLMNALTFSEGNGGNITVNTDTFAAVNGGQLVTTTRATSPNGGNAGNIIVNATDSIILSGSDRTFAERIAQFSTSVANEGAASGLFANTTQGSTGNGGDVRLNTRQLNIRDDARVTVSSLGTGNAGNLLIIAPSLVKLDQGTLSAETASGEGGNVTIEQVGSIQLRNNSLISAKADSSGNGGNINIDTDTLAALENSDITANAFDGKGGSVQITTQGLFLSPDSEITASSERGIDGVVEINRPDVDPSQGLANLPTEVVDASNQIDQTCAAGGSVASGQSYFVITGSGGLPDSPNEALSPDAVWEDLRFVENRKPSLSQPTVPVQSLAATNNRQQATNNRQPTIVEAQGWALNQKGEVVLTATTPTPVLHSSWQKPVACPRS
ncbi:MAG: S-layer family protein [Symplocastrum torsivum CPER-KK1]|jgi:filamentous hemagglutinin family protein|uniref:S-layer family protein n=1 Tax=Symplocastrum torsivum CPER-KK1 TaxID=450513 RepID=A0A951PS28_9CYAN|nr:S-layer family protein [Symplocastrum torsivum CPER-KK1]